MRIAEFSVVKMLAGYAPQLFAGATGLPSGSLREPFSSDPGGEADPLRGAAMGWHGRNRLSSNIRGNSREEEQELTFDEGNRPYPSTNLCEWD